MAKPPPPAPAVAEAPPAPPVRSKKLLILALAAALALVLLAAVVAGLLLLKKGHGASDEAAETAPATVDLSKPPTFVSLDPFIVNLAPAEGERYLQVVMALRVADAKTGDSLKGFMPEIRHQINLLLSSKLPSELATPDGREDLADEIVERTNRALGGSPSKDGGKNGADIGPIQAVLFNSFIIQ